MSYILRKTWLKSPDKHVNILELPGFCCLKCKSNEHKLYRALIWYWDHLKNFIAEIPQGPSGMSIGTIWVTQKRSQGPPARGF